MNTFIAFDIPSPAKAVLTSSLEAYQGKLVTTVPENKWHMTLVFLRNIELSQEAIEQLQQPLHTAYLPAITILSLGAGKQEGQLWAHVHATPGLIELRKMIIDRTTQCGITVSEEELSRVFIPHITIGMFQDIHAGVGISDTQARVTFAPQEALVLQSTIDTTTHYERIATIPLVP